MKKLWTAKYDQENLLEAGQTYVYRQMLLQIYEKLKSNSADCIITIRKEEEENENC